jgi:alkanesulfonate monooxygenase SsuD/methylene tetrahydromethanopterin reductase-like flavin-dependent oxidoreductase (luciferase family)
VRVLEQHCDRVGRDPKSIARSVMYGYVIARDEAEVQRQIDERISRMPPQFRANLSGSRSSLPWLAGTPAQVVEQIQSLEGEGISRIMLQHMTPPGRETLQLLAEEVAPKV